MTPLPFPFWFLDPWILETVPYTGCWFRSHTAFWRTLSQSCKVLSPSWHSYCNFKRPFHHSIKSVDLEWWWKWPDHWIPWAWAHCHTSFTMKWIPWSEAMLCGIPCWWLRHSESRDSSFGNSIMCRECKSTSRVCIPVRVICCPFHDGNRLIYSTSTRLLADQLGIMPHQGLSVGLCCWQTGYHNCGHIQIGLREGKSMLRIPHITSIPATMVTLFRSPLTTTEVGEEGGWLYLHNKSYYPTDY